MLAIAARAFTATSETFIRDHVEGLAPGQTVLICSRNEEIPFQNVPVFHCSPPSKNIYEDPLQWVAKTVAAFSLGMSRPSEEKLAEFLVNNGVRDLLVEYLDHAMFFGRVAKTAGVRLHAHAHGYDASQALKFAKNRFRYRLLFNSAETIFVPSQFIADNLKSIGCPEEKLVVSPCGVKVERFYSSCSTKGLVAAVGRFVEKKAPHISIQSFAEAAKNDSALFLEMIGDGPLLESCKSLAQNLGLADRVIFHGAQSQDAVAALLARASIFIQHSVTASSGDTEGLPVAILEAMAAGLPVISTRHSGIPEVVAHGETGLLVDEGDRAGMAGAIQQLAADEGLTKRMGDAGRQRIMERYTHDHTIERLRTGMGLSVVCPLEIQ